MRISEQFTEQQFKELLEDIYQKVYESELINIEDILRDIQNKLITVVEISNKSNY